MRATARGRIVQRKTEAYLSQMGIDCQFYFTEKTGDAKTLAEKLNPDEVKALGVIGGDGTYNEVLNGMTIDAYPLAVIQREPA